MPPKITAYPLSTPENLPILQPAPRIRHWQRNTADSFAGRCLPLNMANNNGWELLLPGGFDAVYTGNRGLSAIAIYPHGDGPCIAGSHFGEGMLTLFTGYLFRTPAEVHLQLAGPANFFRDGIQALTGLIETDWSPYNATMNYAFTRSGRVRFNKGEPFAQITPTPANYVNGFEAGFGQLERDEPQAAIDFATWSQSRTTFNHGLATGDPDTVKEKWQKLYYRGLYPDGERKACRHATKLTPATFSGTGLPEACPRQTTNPADLRPATALIRAEKLDWRLSRAIDEAATKVAQVIVFYPAHLSGAEVFVGEIPYSNVEAFSIDCDSRAISRFRQCSHFDLVLLLEPNNLMLEGFWSRFEDYRRLLEEKYEAIELSQFRARYAYQTQQQLDEALSAPSDLLEPIHGTLTIMIRRDCLGDSTLKKFHAKDKLILT
jgi:hypothetical protein